MMQAARRLIYIAIATVSLLLAIGPSCAAASAPEAVTEPATEVTSTTAVLNATINSGGYPALVGFEYGLEENTGTGTESVSLGPTGKRHFSQEVTGLQPNSTYYFKVGIIGGSGGTFAEGEVLTFHTARALGLFTANEDSEGPASFRALEYPASIYGAQTSAGPFKVVFGTSGTLSCSSASLKAGMTTLMATLPVNASFAGCQFPPFGTTAAISMNSCHFELHVASVLSGSAGIGCGTSGDRIEAEAPGCTVAFPEQAPTVSAAYENFASESRKQVKVYLQRALAYTKSGTSCFLLSGSANATWEFDLGVE